MAQRNVPLAGAAVLLTTLTAGIPVVTPAQKRDTPILNIARHAPRMDSPICRASGRY